MSRLICALVFGLALGSVSSFLAPTSMGAIGFRDAACTADGTCYVVGSEGRALRLHKDGTHHDLDLPTRSGWFLSAGFNNADFGWITGSRGTLFTSEDRGSSWRDHGVRSDDNIHAAWFLSSHEGFAVGSDGVIFGTRDGGASWFNRYRLPGKTLYAIRALSDSLIYAVGQGGVVLRSIDRGIVWSRVNLDSLTAHTNLYGIAVGDSLPAWIYGAGCLLVTHDGMRWERSAWDGQTAIRRALPYDHRLVAACDSVLVAIGSAGRDTLSRLSNVAVTGMAAIDSEHFVLVGSKGSVTRAYMDPHTQASGTGRRLRLESVSIGIQPPGPGRSEAFKKALQGFLGARYRLGPLGEGLYDPIDPEPLVDLERFDCVTLLETALGMTIGQPGDDLAVTLASIRYRGGRISFLSRNHFFVTDWVPANSWLVEDVTTVLGGNSSRSISRTIGYQRFLQSKNLRVPQYADKPGYATDVIPLERLAEICARIQEPLIVIFVGAADWLFALHTGVVYRSADGRRLILVHASSQHTQVVEEDFLQHVRLANRYVGVKFLRLLD